MFRNIVVLLMLISYLIFFKNCEAEDRIKIGMIDSGISKEQANSKYLCKDGRRSVIYDDKEGYDTFGHGTNIFGLISERINPNTHCIISYKVWDHNFDNTNKKLEIFYSALGIEMIIASGVKYLNISMSGYGFSKYEYKVLESAVKKAIIIVAAGNSGSDLNANCNTYPACYKKFFDKNFIVIGSSTGEYSNEGSIVDFKVDGTKKGTPVFSGTSQSTAIFTGDFVSKK